MKIVVIQKHSHNLDGIKKEVAKLNPKRATEILFTSDPDTVIRVTKDGKPVLVISGQVLGTTYRGTDLVEDIKRVNRQVLFYIYSLTPETNRLVDGVIPKGSRVQGDKKLAGLLASNLEGAPRESIQALMSA